ncbi:Ku protein [Rhizobium sp. TH2]|uniref:non-homologous end joining protein Ku n=1 Tax=Rhizobium sp. TH2 TaxID=2775403 RepID=UPI0021584A68|nr:Ku protein [Rhizobium sp. TH2]UVC08115.1 Ku protein [Rhizobium sp. TH2]
MAPRANWKGYLKLGELNCAVALYTAASTSDRVSFHMVNRQTGNRLNREFVDSETGKPVERDEQIKGYEVSGGDYVTLEPEEVAAAVPESDRMLEIGDFVNCSDIDDVFFDKPYYLAPADKQSKEVYALIREGLTANKVAAIAQTVLFRRVRTLLIRPHGEGLIASTLNYEYEVRPAADAFKDMPKLKLEPEMLELASHIIDTKMGKFDPSEFNDRYDAALAELVKAKIEGRKIRKPKPIKETKPADLLEALRRSASGGGKAPPAKRTAKSGAKSQPMRKAG